VLYLRPAALSSRRPLPVPDWVNFCLQPPFFRLVGRALPIQCYPPLPVHGLDLFPPPALQFLLVGRALPSPHSVLSTASSAGSDPFLPPALQFLLVGRALPTPRSAVHCSGLPRTAAVSAGQDPFTPSALFPIVVVLLVTCRLLQLSH